MNRMLILFCSRTSARSIGVGFTAAALSDDVANFLVLFSGLYLVVVVGASR